MTTYVRYSDDLEQPFPGEEELIRQITDAMERANQQVAAKHRHGLRDAHAKSHGVLAGELRIQPDLPGHLAQGLFAEPRSYPVIVRLSTAPGDLRSDQVPVQRGFAIKVLGAAGPRAADDGLSTQDFLLVNHPTIPFGTIGEYVKLQKLLETQPRQSDQQLQLSGLAARAAAQVLTRLGLKDAGISPAPRRDGPGWAEFLRSQAQGILALDFSTAALLNGTSVYVLAAIEHGTRRI